MERILTPLSTEMQKQLKRLRNECINKAFDKGETIEELAKQYGLHAETVRLIVRNRVVAKPASTALATVRAEAYDRLQRIDARSLHRQGATLTRLAALGETSERMVQRFLESEKPME